jgi:hypothetical protein
MKCYACGNDPIRSCPRCGKLYCADHGNRSVWNGPVCEDCAPLLSAVSCLTCGIVAVLFGGLLLMMLGFFAHRPY